MTTVEELRGSRILILNWRDIQHPLAGGAEQYIHEIGARWAKAGAGVTWFTARGEGQSAREVIDGMHILRAGGTLSVYARAAARALRARGHFDAVVDCQNGIPFFAPLFAGPDAPVVQVVHHVHQDQFATRFSRPMAAVGRMLEGPVARRVYRERPVVAVSPSTRTELRRQLGFRGPIFVVPNGTAAVPAADARRATVPTIVLVTRLVPHKQVDLLLAHLAAVTGKVPELRVEIVGDGPERTRLQALAADLGLHPNVRFHGRVSDEARDELMSRAWLTTSTSAAEGWGLSVLEAAAWGVPCLALEAPGVRDAVLHGETGWLVDHRDDFTTALVDAIEHLEDRGRAETMATTCRTWAGCFSWDRSAELLAGVVLEEMRFAAAKRQGQTPNRRSARSDMAVLAGFPAADAAAVRSALRATDEVVEDGNGAAVVLTGCDEFTAAGVLARIGVRDGSFRLVDRRLLLGGPGAPRTVAAGAAENKARSA